MKFVFIYQVKSHFLKEKSSFLGFRVLTILRINKENQEKMITLSGHLGMKISIFLSYLYPYGKFQVSSNGDRAGELQIMQKSQNLAEDDKTDENALIIDD